MKINRNHILSLALLAMAGTVSAETVHQTVAAGKFFSGDGSNAVAKGQMEASTFEGKELARVKGDMVQWGFVNCWFGLPAPAGKSTLRFSVYYEGPGKAAKYMLYTRTKGEQAMVGELKVPADAKENSFVTIEVPVTAKEEWSGLVIKKAEKSELPSLWIETVSTVLAE